MATKTKTTAEFTAIKAEVEKYLLGRGLVRVDDRDITGVNKHHEFHIFLGSRGIIVTMISRYTYAPDDVFVAYDDEVFAKLSDILSR